MLKKNRGQILTFRKSWWDHRTWQEKWELFCSCRDCCMCLQDVQDFSCISRCNCLYCRAPDRVNDRGVELYTEFGLDFESTSFVRADMIVKAVDIFRRLQDIEYWPCRLENIAVRKIVDLVQDRDAQLRHHMEWSLFLRLVFRSE